jgi:excinuclease ABC subunit B
MGPHASLPVKSGKPLLQKPQLPARTIEIEDPAETKSRRGRPKKTGRPGR